MMKIKRKQKKGIEDHIRLAFQYHQAGDLQKAEFLYTYIAGKYPNNFDALHMLGVINSQLGKYSTAIQYIEKALQIKPMNANAYYNLGNVYLNMEQPEKASIHFKKALQINITFVDGYIHMGSFFLNTRHFDEAISCFEKVLQLKPELSEAHNNLGIALQAKGQLDKAISCYEEAIKLNPRLTEAYNNIATIFKDKNKLNEAEKYIMKALQLDPNSLNACINWGNILMKKGHITEAIGCYKKALQCSPNFVEIYLELANAFKEKGRLVEAVEYCKLAIQLKPNNVIAHQNLLYFMFLNPRNDAQSIFTEHLKFSKQFAEPLSSSLSPHTNAHIPNRRLRIGYVSPDLKRHSVTYFLEPVLSAHNSDRFEIFCYSDVKVSDEVTRRIQGYAEHWKNIVGMSDEQVAEQIRDDTIDILIDLAGHTASNRILLFARKPAPVQASWIGYPATTGLSTMDYKIVDAYTDPPGMTEQFYTERLIRMPESFLCYQPDPDSPEVGTLPSLTKGYISFGSFNNFPKMTREVISLWIRILKAVPDSHLVLKAKSLSDEETREYALEMFTREGIERQRLRFLPWVPSTMEHLDLYNQIDIALDTFPYNGTTTTCEALWMGVPVITLVGNTHVSRVGMSLLSNVGLPELIAKTHDEYVAIAVNLANDLNKLQSLRRFLRDMMSHSPLMDAGKFIAHLEDCYRSMWEQWCKSGL